MFDRSYHPSLLRQGNAATMLDTRPAKNVPKGTASAIIVRESSVVELRSLSHYIRKTVLRSYRRLLIAVRLCCHGRLRVLTSGAEQPPIVRRSRDEASEAEEFGKS